MLQGKSKNIFKVKAYFKALSKFQKIEFFIKKTHHYSKTLTQFLHLFKNAFPEKKILKLKDLLLHSESVHIIYSITAVGM